MSEIKAVVFDCDGMINIEDRFSGRLARTYGISTEKTSPFFKKQFQDCLVGAADLKEELAAVVEKWGWQKSIEELMQEWFDERSNVIDMQFAPVMQHLASRGVRRVLATNNEIYRTRFMLGRLPKDWFDEVFSSARVGARKPDRVFFDHIVKKMRVKPDETLFGDDDEENVQAAAAFGFRAERYTGFDKFSARMREYSF